MREERRRSMGRIPEDFDTSTDEFVLLAKKHYFAIVKVKDGKFSQAEHIDPKIIDELVHDDMLEGCDHAQLAVTALFLALLTKRMGDPKKMQFFRIAVLEREEDGLAGICTV